MPVTASAYAAATTGTTGTRAGAAGSASGGSAVSGYGPRRRALARNGQRLRAGRGRWIGRGDLVGGRFGVCRRGSPRGCIGAAPGGPKHSDADRRVVGLRLLQGVPRLLRDRPQLGDTRRGLRADGGTRVLGQGVDQRRHHLRERLRIVLLEFVGGLPPLRLVLARLSGGRAVRDALRRVRLRLFAKKPAGAGAARTASTIGIISRRRTIGELHDGDAGRDVGALPQTGDRPDRRQEIRPTVPRPGESNDWVVPHPVQVVRDARPEPP